MRTNIVLDEDLLREAMRYSAARSKRRLVEEALRTFVEVKSTERRRQAYDDRLRQIEPRLQSLRLTVSPAQVLRADRERDA